MKISEMQKAGLVHSPSVRRWLSEGAVPGIGPVAGKVRDLDAVEAATLATFDAVAAMGDLTLARDMARLVHQHVASGILTPVVATRGVVSVSVNVADLWEKVGDVVSE